MKKVKFEVSCLGFLIAINLVCLVSLNGVAKSKDILHPDAAKGLVRIEKDGAYIYQTNDLDTKKSSSFKIGLVEPPAISSFYTDKNSQEQELRFEDMYGGSPIPIMNYEYEWQLESVPNLGYHLGVGLFLAEGNGRLIATNEESEEKFTFIGLPLNTGLTFRFKFSSKQIVVPYFTAGGTYFLTAEKRDDKSIPQFFGVWGGYAGAGALISISKLDRETGFNLQNEYGFSNLWLVAEFRYLKTASDLLDFGVGYFTGGFAVDF